jgi:hypothetical protein
MVKLAKSDLSLNCYQNSTVYVQKKRFTKDFVFSSAFIFSFILEKFFAINNNAMKAFNFAFITLNQQFSTFFNENKKHQ